MWGVVNVFCVVVNVLSVLSLVEERGIFGVVVECVDIRKNICSEGGALGWN